MAVPMQPRQAGNDFERKLLVFAIFELYQKKSTKSPLMRRVKKDSLKKDGSSAGFNYFFETHFWHDQSRNLKKKTASPLATRKTINPPNKKADDLSDDDDVF